MVSPSDFVDGSRIKWDALAGTIIGGAFLAFFQGIIAVILRWIEYVTTLLDGLAEFLAAEYGLVLGAPARIISESWAEAQQFVLNSGPAGFVVAVGLVLLTLYVVAVGVNLIR